MSTTELIDILDSYKHDKNIKDFMLFATMVKAAKEVGGVSLRAHIYKSQFGEYIHLNIRLNYGIELQNGSIYYAVNYYKYDKIEELYCFKKIINYFDYLDVYSEDDNLIDIQREYLERLKDVEDLISLGKKERNRQKELEICLPEDDADDQDCPIVSIQQTYLMNDENTGFYKIGKSKNPKYRESTLQSEKPTINLIHVIKQDIERELHNKFSDKRIRGEWFRLNDEDVSLIKQMI